ncbi:MAG: hypothetical protein ABIK07_25875, partial [Planctomycetota bacterium]
MNRRDFIRLGAIAPVAVNEIIKEDNIVALHDVSVETNNVLWVSNLNLCCQTVDYDGGRELLPPIFVAAKLLHTVESW